jgi:hypothetical protein
MGVNYGLPHGILRGRVRCLNVYGVEEGDGVTVLNEI